MGACCNGNPLMRGWTVADISFYTIEIPELAVLEWLHGGISPDVLSVAEALNLTVLVLLVAFLAKGRATGREGLVRAVVAGGIVCAPVAGANSTLMLSNPDHLATQIFVLAAWLIVDRARPRWWVPVAVAVVLAWARMSDSIVLLEAELPLLAVCAVRVYRRGGALRDQWYDLSLGAAAIAAELIAQLVLVTIRAMGGFTAYPLQETFAPVSELSTHIWVTVESTLLLYGADFSGLPLKGNLALLTAAVHMIGVALAVVGGRVRATAVPKQRPDAADRDHDAGHLGAGLHAARPGRLPPAAARTTYGRCCRPERSSRAGCCSGARSRAGCSRWWRPAWRCTCRTAGGLHGPGPVPAPTRGRWRPGSWIIISASGCPTTTPPPSSPWTATTRSRSRR